MPDPTPTEPTKEPVTEPVKEPVTEPVKEPVTEPTKEPVTEPVKEPVTEPVKEPSETPEAKAKREAQEAELEALRAFKKEADEKEEAARQAQLTKEQKLEEDLAQARLDAEKAAREVLIAQSNVPEEIKPLLPQTGLAEYLKSDSYLSLKASIEASKVVSPPADPEPKGGTPPGTKSEPNSAPKTLEDLTPDTLSGLGNLLLGVME